MYMKEQEQSKVKFQTTPLRWHRYLSAQAKSPCFIILFYYYCYVFFTSGRRQLRTDTAVAISFSAMFQRVVLRTTGSVYIRIPFLKEPPAASAAACLSMSMGVSHIDAARDAHEIAGSGKHKSETRVCEVWGKHPAECSSVKSRCARWVRNEHGVGIPNYVIRPRVSRVKISTSATKMHEGLKGKSAHAVEEGGKKLHVHCGEIAGNSREGKDTLIMYMAAKSQGN